MKKRTVGKCTPVASRTVQSPSAPEPISDVVSRWAKKFDWTAAEGQVFRMRADGLALKEIAVLRCCEVDTVQKQVLSLRRKMGGRERLQDVVERALREAANGKRRDRT
jgi:DNA-binding CsgD family transcriptional regulator